MRRPSIQGERAGGPFLAAEAEVNSTRFSHIVVDDGVISLHLCACYVFIIYLRALVFRLVAEDLDDQVAFLIDS